MWLRVSLFVLSLLFCTGSAQATTVYEFFVEFHRQDFALQIAFATEAFRSAHAGDGKRAGCIDRNFIRHSPAFMPVYEAFKSKLYSTPTATVTEVETSIADAIEETCTGQTLQTTPDLSQTQLTVHTNESFHTEARDDFGMFGAIHLAVATQLARVESEGDDEYAQCLADKIAVTGAATSAGFQALYAALKNPSPTMSAPSVEQVIVGAIIYYCKEEPSRQAAADPAPPAIDDKPMSDLDNENAKAYEDFQKRLSTTGKVLDELEIENKQKAAEAMEQVAALQRKTFRVPDGRRIYPSADGNWRFEDQSRVPPDLVAQRVEPPREGWPSLDMRIPPTFDQKGVLAVYMNAPKEAIDSMSKDDLPQDMTGLPIVAERLQIYAWEQAH